MTPQHAAPSPLALTRAGGLPPLSKGLCGTLLVRPRGGRHHSTRGASPTWKTLTHFSEATSRKQSQHSSPPTTTAPPPRRGRPQSQSQKAVTAITTKREIREPGFSHAGREPRLTHGSLPQPLPGGTRPPHPAARRLLRCRRRSWRADRATCSVWACSPHA